MQSTSPCYSGLRARYAIIRARRAVPLRVGIITDDVIVRVQFVLDPSLRIGCDVFGNPVVIGLVLDNMFVIITLPDRQAGIMGSDLTF